MKNNACPPCITAAAGTELAGASYSSTVNIFLDERALHSKGDSITHVTLLDHDFSHCPIFLTAASKKSLDRIPVPVWLIILSDQLEIIGLVGSYPTNYLISHEYFFIRIKPLGIFSTKYEEIFHALRTRTLPIIKKDYTFNSHVLSMSQAFIQS